MIIDVHSRIWSSVDHLGRDAAARLRGRYADRWESLDASPTAHEQAMVCVDAACVFGFRSQMTGACVPNEYIADFVARDPQRRIGIAGIDPMSPAPGDDIDAAISMGLAGVTVSPASQGFHPAHSAAMRVYERCDELHLPVFFTLGAPLTSKAMLEFGRPVALDEVARAVPTLKIVVTELGYPWINETLILIGKHENVYADISGLTSQPWQLYNALLTATASGVMARLLFGSGFPFTTPAATIESLYSINSFGHGTQLPSVQRSLVRAMVERNSLECLGLAGQLGGRPRTPAGAVAGQIGFAPIANGTNGLSQRDDPQSAEHETT